jgi:hypothetical protein
LNELKKYKLEGLEVWHVIFYKFPNKSIKMKIQGLENSNGPLNSKKKRIAENSFLNKLIIRKTSSERRRLFIGHDPLKVEKFNLDFKV